MPLSRRFLLAGGVALTVAGCATRPGLVTSGQTWPELEPLLGVTATREGLRIRVASKGCAVREDFVFRLDRSGGKAVVAFARRRLETCRFGETAAADLAFSYEELGLRRAERFEVANPITPSR